jgi:low temperature requirement protein LtrA
VSSKRSRRRPHHGEEEAVTPLELFFDLVYVFAVSQLSHHLLHHQSWTGAAQTLVLFVAVFAVWLQTTWTAVTLDINRRPVQWMLLVVMVLGLYMNAAIGSAFDGSAWMFIALYLVINLGRDLWVRTASPREFLRDHYQRMLVWAVVAGIPWLVGAADHEHRLAWWALAASIDLVGIVAAHPLPRRRLRSENEEIPRSRIFERARLFFIIALGEAVLTTGVAIAEHLTDRMTLLTGTVALAGAVAIWWSYFDVREAAAYAILKSSTDPTRTAVRAFNALFVTVAAMIIMAVGDEIVIAHPHGRTSMTTVLLLYTGPVLYLGFQAWQARHAKGRVLVSRFIGIVALVTFACLSVLVPPFLAAIGATVPLIYVAVVDGRTRAIDEPDTSRTMTGAPHAG